MPNSHSDKSNITHLIPGLAGTVSTIIAPSVAACKTISCTASAEPCAHRSSDYSGSHLTVLLQFTLNSVLTFSVTRSLSTLDGFTACRNSSRLFSMLSSILTLPDPTKSCLSRRTLHDQLQHDPTLSCLDFSSHSINM